MSAATKSELTRAHKFALACLIFICATLFVSIIDSIYSLPLAAVLTLATKTALALAMATALAFAGMFGGMALFESWLDANMN